MIDYKILRRAKLTEDDVRTIRKRYEVGDITQQALAKEYGVDQTTINHVINWKNWRWVK